MEATKTQESQYARSLIEASLDPLVTISTEGKITDMNQALANITGMTREKLTGTDLDYLIRRTKSNPKLMMEMITAYLEQTPPLISAMKQSLQDQDWNSLHAAVHKMIPSFAIMGISTDFENTAKKVQECASTQQQTDGINDLVLQLGSVCTQACKELEEEFNKIKNANS